MSDTAVANSKSEEARSWKDAWRANLNSGMALARYFARALVTVFRIAPVLAGVSVLGAVVTSLLPFSQAYLYALSINRLTSFVGRGQAHSFAQMWPVIWPFVASSAMFVVQKVISLALQTNSGWLQNELESALELELVKHVVLLDLQTQEDSEFRNMLNRAGQASNTFMQALGWVNSMGSALITLGISTALVVRLNPLLIALFVGVSLPGFVVAIRQSALYDKLWRHGVEYAMTQIFTNYMMRCETNTEIRLNNAHGHLAQVANNFRISWRNRRRKVQVRAAVYGLLADTVEIAVQLAVEVWLVMRVLTVRGFSFGSLMFYTTIIDQFSGSITSLFNQVSEAYELSIDLRAYYRVMDTKSKVASPPNPRRIPVGHVPHIEFRDVGFTYDSRDTPTLRNVNLVIRPGERIALVGENGSGKSTLIKLLLRLYDPTEGAILVDGHDLREYSVEDWHRLLAVLLQDYNSYPTSARENVEIGEIEAAGDDHRVDDALDRSQARSVVNSLKKGLGTKLSRHYVDGEWLSGGQRQRLALARTLFRRDAGLLVLDEPTAAVDAVAEEKFFRQMLDEIHGRTLVIISHRITTVKRAGRVVVLAEGRVLEDGSHDELMRIDGGIYQTLFQAQAENLAPSPVPAAA